MEIHISGLGKYSLTIVVVAFIIGFTICYLVKYGYNLYFSMEKEKIEVNAIYSNQTK